MEQQDPPRLVDLMQTPAGLRAILGRAQRETVAASEIEELVVAVERRIGAPHSTPANAAPLSRAPANGWSWTKYPWVLRLLPVLAGAGVIGALGFTVGRRVLGRRDAQVAVVQEARSVGGAEGQIPAAFEHTEKPAATGHDTPSRGPSTPSREPDQTAPQDRLAAGHPQALAAPRDTVVPRAVAADPEEYKLLRAARSTLSSDPVRALALTDEHKRRYTRGMLVQEREAIAIEAMAHLGRMSEAKARARRFLAQYPQSPYRSRIESALGRSTGSTGAGP